MESAKIGNEYTLMINYDFNKPIDAAIIFDSDEDESNKEMIAPEKEDSGHQNVTYERKKRKKRKKKTSLDEHTTHTDLDMPSLEGLNSTNDSKLSDGIKKSRVIKIIEGDKYKTLKKKLKRKIKSKIKEIESKRNELSSSSLKKHKKYQLTSSAEPSGPPNEVSNDIRSQINSAISSSLSNSANGQTTESAAIEPKVELIEDSDVLCENISSEQNTSNFTLPNSDNSQPEPTCVHRKIKPVQDSWPSKNIAYERINPHTSISSSPTNSTQLQSQLKSAYVELKEESKPIKIMSQQQLSTSYVPPSTVIQSLSASIDQRVKSVGPSCTSANDVSGEMRNKSISSLRTNTDSSCHTFKNVSEEIRNQHNISSSSSSTNTNNAQPITTAVIQKNQTEQNNDNSWAPNHLKPLLDTVSEHLILILKKIHSCLDVFNDNSIDFGYKEHLKKKIYNYKIRLFDLSYSTVVSVILPRAYEKTFVKGFIDNTVALSKSETRQTTREISLLYMEMIHWTQKMKHQIASESIFEHEITRQPLAPTATSTSDLPGIVPNSTTLGCASTHTTTRPPETQRQWNTRSYPYSPYTSNRIPPPQPQYTNSPLPPPPPYNPQVPYSNLPPQYNNQMPAQPYFNNVITPTQTKNPKTHGESQQAFAKPKQKKNGRLNQGQQVTVSEVARHAVNPSDGFRQVSQNITQINNFNNNHNVYENHTRITSQDYQPINVSALPDPTYTQSVNHVSSKSANNSQYPRDNAESEYQNFIRTSRSRNLPNNNTSSQNHYYGANDTPSQGANEYPNNAYLNQANNIHQESDRSSISRDSGFFSPRDVEQDHPTSPLTTQVTSPLITHVTSLNPDAVNITEGSCSICRKKTNQKCIGCYTTYYCSYGCQNADWQYHISYCNTNQELRRLLSK